MTEIIQAESSKLTDVGKIATDDTTKIKVAAAGGIFGALAASTCCVIPLVLFSLGISGVWIGQLTALSVYQPLFITATLGFLGYGYWLVYRKSKKACADGQTCARPLPNKIVKTGMWVATALIALAIAWPYILPIILGPI